MSAPRAVHADEGLTPKKVVLAILVAAVLLGLTGWATTAHFVVQAQEHQLLADGPPDDLANAIAQCSYGDQYANGDQRDINISQRPAQCADRDAVFLDG